MTETRVIRLRLRTAVIGAAVVVVLLAGRLSAHVIRGLDAPLLATAFVSSPSAAGDLPIPIEWGSIDTGLRVICFHVANTSPERADRPGWPRVTGIGFELPDRRAGFTLVEPRDAGWELQEDVRASLPGRGTVPLDFAIVADVNPTGRTRGRKSVPEGIPPGQAAARGSGTRFCVSGPFPDALSPTIPGSIEQIINGVVVGFHGVEGNEPRVDLGIWENPARVVPLYPQ